MELPAEFDVMHFHDRELRGRRALVLLLDAEIHGAKLPRSQPPVGVDDERVHHDQARIKRIPGGTLGADCVRPSRAGTKFAGVIEAGDGLGAHG